VKLLAYTAKDAEDPQTLCMVAGALANLCGNGKLCTEKSKLLMLVLSNQHPLTL
jgi:hypothetical protein